MTPPQKLDAHWQMQIQAIAERQDKSAFADLFRHYAPKIKAFLMRSGLDAAMAEDCMQDVMVTLWRKAHLYDPTRAAPTTWVFTIARNRKIDLLRRAARPEPEDLPWGPEEPPDPSEALTLQQETAQLTDAIRALPAAQRELVEKAYLGELTHQQIAQETGLPLGTIKSRIRLALERLRRTMNRR